MDDSALLRAWQDNAQGWGRLVREKLIESRSEVTDDAILEACGPPSGRALDLGCGEGWLTRALGQKGWQCVGIDAVADLVKQARQAGEQVYIHGQYRDLNDHFGPSEFDLVVANFSLLGEETTTAAVGQVAHLLKEGGRFLIQTLHPSSLDQPETSRWQVEEWDWIPSMALSSSPWYFRSLADWRELLEQNDLRLVNLTEPKMAGTDEPSSMILECEPLVYSKSSPFSRDG